MAAEEEEFITPLAEAAAWRDALDREGRRVVLTNGCFDLLHAGHVRYLREARALGDALLVALNSDASVRELKGEGRPVNPAADRAEILRSLRSVDRVVVYDEKRATAVIDAVRPHLYAKGGDYTVESLNPEEKTALDRAGAEIHLLSLVPGRSTSGALKRLNRSAEPRKLRLAALGSGLGGNLQSILDAIDRGELDAEVRLVISDRADAGILEKARARGIPALHVEPGSEKPARISEAALKEIVDRLDAADIDLVILGGFLRIVRPPLLTAYAGRILNVHPSLLPKYPGLKAWEQAFDAGEAEAGCTIHLVDAGVDTGEILGQARVPVLSGDTPDTLYRRIQREEYRLYPQVIGEYGRKWR